MGEKMKTDKGYETYGEKKRIDKCYESYLRDPIYKNMVDCMYEAIESLHLTPSEMREASMLACIMFEERKPYSSLIYNETENETQQSICRNRKS